MRGKIRGVFPLLGKKLPFAITSSRLMCGVGVVRDGHGENVRESLKPVHYDYKNRLEEYDAKV